MLSVDEKSHVQAPDRTQPGLPLKKGRPDATTHDYMRHGTTTFFAALNVIDGTVIGGNMQRHRHQEFIRFLDAINVQLSADKAVHVILDNYAAHEHLNVRAWLDSHQRFTFQFTPTSRSRLNTVAGFFSKPSKRRLRRGVFTRSLTSTPHQPLPGRAQPTFPSPFTWTADPDKIAAVKRAHHVLDSIH